MRRSPFVALLAAATLVIAACGGSDDDAAPAAPGQPDKVKAGVIPIVDVAPIYLGKEKGFFSNRNIDLTLETGAGRRGDRAGRGQRPVPVRLQQRRSRCCSPSPQNVPIKVVANGINSTGEDGKDFGGVVVKADSPIKTRQGLAGKKVAANTLKNIVDTQVRESVSKAGGDPATVNFVELPFPDMCRRARRPARWTRSSWSSRSCGGDRPPAPGRSRRLRRRRART